MELSFWQERWQTRQIGFHEGRPNAMLERHVGRLGLGAGARVLVPLCGKAVDVPFLAARAEVVGVELVETAVAELFAEQGVTPSVEGARRSHGSLSVWVGDYFGLGRAALGTFDAIYDRAALIALHPSMRERYVAHTVSMAKPGARLLLVGFSYDQTVMQGPPWSLDLEAVQALYAPHGTVTLLEENEILDENPRFRERGATWVRESCTLVELG